MDPKDRLFGEIAVRLKLLSREQVAKCIHEQAVHGIRIGELACKLGYMSREQMTAVLAHQEKILVRRRAAREAAANSSAALVEERAPVADPRSASLPPQQGRAPKPAPRAKVPAAPQTPLQVQEVAAPERVSKNADRPPRPPRSNSMDFGATMALMPAPAPPMELADTRPGDEPQLNAASGLELDDTAPGDVGQSDPQAPAQSDAPYDFGDAAGDAVPAAAAAPAPAAPAPAPEPVPRAAAMGTVVGIAPQEMGGNDELKNAFGAAVQAARNKRKGFGDDWRNASAPPAAAAPEPEPEPEPAASPAQGSGRSNTVIQPFGGTLVQSHGVAQAAAAPAATQAEVAFRPSTPAEERAEISGRLSGTYLGKALGLAMQQGASDLHAHSDAPIMMRVDGRLVPLSGNDPLSAEAAHNVIHEVMTETQWQLLEENGEVDFAMEIRNLARFRVNAYREQRGLDIVFRIIPPKVPTFAELGLPERLGKLADYRTGMVLFTGPAGCGKSTSLAALINLLIQNRQDHMLTIEDPVEFVFPPGPCLVNQRQVGDHTDSFSRALRAALREDPDIIAITELRDRETMELAISAAETGHLVLATLHTGNAGQTISRIVNAFPAEEQEQVRVMLAESLRAVVSQRLVPKKEGRGRAPAIELMMVTTAVMNVIRDDKTHQLPSVMQTGKAMGMVTLDDSLLDLVQNGVVTTAEARRFAVKKERFKD